MRRFLLRKPKTLLAFFTVRSMCSFQSRLLERSTPKYLDVDSSASSWPFSLWVDLSGVRFLVTRSTLHLSGWKDIPHFDSHCARLTRLSIFHVRGSRGRDRWSAPSWKNHKNIGFHSNTGSDSLKNHKTTKPAFNVGPSSAHQ